MIRYVKRMRGKRDAVDDENSKTAKNGSEFVENGSV
jgi:hypothetical protein